MTDQANLERLQKDFEAVKKDVSNLAQQLTESLNSLAGTAQTRARRGYNQARAQVDAAVSDAADRGSAALDMAQDAANSLEETIEDAITERPIAAVGLAIGLGFLIGVTWRR
jgi:ElaB/YqjD/DUF883 family membrane-anchored ribosome-binding protein